MAERRSSDNQDNIIDLPYVIAARGGSASAFDVLVGRYYARIAAYLYRLTGDREIAAELTQETFLAAYRSLHRLTGDRSFAAWLYRIALYQTRPFLRRRQILRFVPLDHVIDQVTSWVGRPAEAQPEDVHERELIQDALNELPEGQRAVLLLHSLAGFTTEEVASILGTSVSATTRRITRARLRFQGVYTALSDEPAAGRDRAGDGQ